VSTTKQLDRYRAGWLEYKRRKEQELTSRYDDAIAKARLAAGHIKQRYNGRVFLFGSLLRRDKFMEHSDIDLAVADLAPEVNFWELYAAVMNALHPFEFDLVELERIDPLVREHILNRGIEL